MATLTILLAVALFTGSAYSTPTRIVGGEPTTVEQFPSIVQVEFLGTGSGIWSQSCAGHILTSSYVLTAAHCFSGINYSPRNRCIRAGSSTRQTGGLVSSVEVEFNHPTFGPNDMEGDISVVRLLQPLQYSSVIQQGPIVSQGFVMPDDLAVVIAGWGATQLGSIPSDELQQTTVFTINHELCAEQYNNLSIPRQVTENMICAGLLGKGSSCQGDFGGPLYLGNIVVGIQSWGQGCGDEALPGVNTAVSSYTDWIVSIAV